MLVREHELTQYSSCSPFKHISLIELRCEDNTFKEKPTLKSLVSLAIVSDRANNENLLFAEKGHKCFEEFGPVRLISTSKLSVWEMKKNRKRTRSSH